MRKRVLFRGIRLFLGMSIFANTAFAGLAESNVWESRATARARAAKPETTLLASLPALGALAPALSSRLPSSVGQSTPLQSHPHNSSFVSFPAAYGSISRMALPASGRPKKFVVHIQDIHRNVEAQRNISSALRDMAERSDVHLIGLEAAFTPLALETLTEKADGPSLAAVSDALLATNDIAGPLHAALRLKDVLFAGVDDQALYIQNGRAYRQAQKELPAATQALQAERDALAQQKDDRFNNALRSFDAAVDAYAGGKTSLTKHAAFLLRPSFTASRTTREMARFLEAATLEAGLNFPAVERERAQVLAALSSRLTATGAEDLLREALLFKSGELSSAQFYGELITRCRKAGVALEKYPAMNAFVRYALVADRIDADALFKEVREAENAGYRALTTSPEEKALVAQAHHHRLREKLVAFALSSDEWTTYEEMGVSAAMKPFEDFYRAARKRDDAMASRLLAAMENRSDRVSVLVTGGFHNRGIEQALLRAGVGVVTAVPKITSVDAADGSAYLTAFLRERTPLENLFGEQRLFLAEPVATRIPLVQVSALTAIKEVLNGVQPRARLSARLAELAGA